MGRRHEATSRSPNATTRAAPCSRASCVDARVAEIDYVLRYDHSGEDLTWQLERGEVVRQLDGRYRIDEQDGTSDVEYALEVDVTLPSPGS